ncbi:MAG: NAD(P)-binding protein [Alphaproteobacteria bacterium]|nr:NAD(P)-binding protein [Alphaproteobacteria bacterium]
MRIAIIGAGMAGLACADALKPGGFEITVFEKSRGTGGRLATRRSEIGGFDHGAQFVTARDNGFKAYLKRAKSAGYAARWKTPASGEDVWWTGRPGMSGLVKPLADGLALRKGERVTGLSAAKGGWTLHLETGEEEGFDAVLLAIPVQQALDLLTEHAGSFSALSEVSIAPSWTVLLGFKKPVPISDDVIRHSGPIAWAARENARPKRDNKHERWVIQASADWSRDNLEDYGAAVLEVMREAFAEAVGAPLPELIHADAHRWRYAKVETALGQPCLWDKGLGLGLAGDWCLAPRVEAAFLSGRALADAVMATHGR